MMKTVSSSLKNLLLEPLIFLLLGLSLSLLGPLAQRTYIISFLLLSGPFLAGGVMLSMAAMFRAPWALPFRDMAPLWKIFSLKWVFYFLPLIFFASDIYHWGAFTGNKALYFSLPFLLLRCVSYLVLGGLAAHKIRELPALSLILFFFIGTFFSFDWAMSLEKEWSSNIYGLIFLIEGALGFWALILLLTFDGQKEKERQDLYRITVTLCALWAYLHYSQFLVFWMSNRPGEIEWYLKRSFDQVPIMSLMVLTLKLLPAFAVGPFPEHRTTPIIFKGIMISILFGTYLEMIWLLATPLQIETLMGTLITLPVLALLSVPVFLWARRKS